ncbi:LPS assembly protein LptD [Salinimonas marina]|uniref:LPS-assembly protein LptD n=1 Tax=Salinimonas marina TaxID=2785918 RepID=A0A7S9HCS7_9ALTE|nr:LPS assembly protein LptD [Salinimonas marina]QPG05197.1 LPS assembly protein LptD [Salinimonas marina]
MKKTCASLLLFSLGWSSAQGQTTSDTSEPEPRTGMELLCPASPVQFSSTQLMSTGEVKVEADSTEFLSQRKANFSGNVDITSDAATIRADEAQVKNNGRQLQASGDVQYQDAQLQVNSDEVMLDSVTETLNMSNTEYHLNGSNGRGTARMIDLTSADGLTLTDVSFTTCPAQSRDWMIKASEISIERDSMWGQAKNTRFYVGDVPVFYLPYFAFPVSDQRQTGLLFPEISSSSNTGLDIEQPFYWNMAPNYDMTVSPRLMTDRGVQLKTQFRYLSEQGYSMLDVEYLPSDKDTPNEDNRYFYRLAHDGYLSQNWTVGVDVNGISDDNYIVDLGSEYYNRADTHLARTLGLNYFAPDMLLDIHIRDFETIGFQNDSYRALPEARLAITKPFARYFEFSLDSELAYFDNKNDTSPTAMRFHVAPTLALPYQRHWGELSAEATVLNTYYRQSNIDDTDLADEVNRTLGQGRLFGTLYFERDGGWFSDTGTTTLEPKVQYLYTSYEDQREIGIYDTTVLLTDMESLFRGREFTGLDRINDNNQVTVGVTSRILDDAHREQFALSLGQIFYFGDNQVISPTQNQDRSALAAELDWRMTDRWYFHSDVQIMTQTDKVERSSHTLEYRRDAESLVQLTHRYVRELSGETIDQVGISASWPINQNWHWVGRTYRDLERNRSIESYFGLQYESCCWAIQVVAQRQLSNRFADDGQQSTDEYDSGIGVQFIFKGLGSSKSSRRMLEDGMFGYRQPYNLN